MKTLGRQAVLSLTNYRLSEELAESRELAAMAKVSSFVIHDLKNLVYSFSLMVDNAERYIGEPAFQRDLVDSLRNTVVTMDSLIAKLKAFPGKLELHTSPADVDRIAGEAVAEARRVKPETHIVAELQPARAVVDAVELRRVVFNLLLNACEASEAGGSVRVATGAVNGEATVLVADQGRGMSESFLKNDLFRPFRTTKEKGLGIGLYQCRQVVERHGGTIDVTSEEGRGTTFTVTLPGEGASAGSNTVG
jgi:putative PEP-CTERM system histidine kinase